MTAAVPEDRQPAGTAAVAVVAVAAAETVALTAAELAAVDIGAGPTDRLPRVVGSAGREGRPAVAQLPAAEHYPRSAGLVRLDTVA